MKNQSFHPMPQGRPTPRQAAGNRRIAVGLALFAFCVFATVIIRQWLASG